MMRQEALLLLLILAAVEKQFLKQSILRALLRYDQDRDLRGLQLVRDQADLDGSFCACTLL